MFLQAMETASASFLGSSLIYWLWWLGSFLLASAVYWFGYGSRYRNQVEDKETMIKKLRPQLGVLTNQKEHLTSENKSLKASLEEMVKKHSSVKSYHDSLQNKYQTATKQYEQANEERQSLLSSYESLEKNLEATELNYNNALAKIDKLEAELENMEEGTVSTSPSKDQILPYQQEIEKLQGILNSKDAEINKLNISLAAKPQKQIKVIEKAGVQKEFALKKEALEKENSKLEAAYSALQNDYNQLRNAHTTLTNNFQELEEKSQGQNVVQLDTLENNQLQLQLKSLESKYTDLGKLKRQVDLQIAQKEKAINELKSTNQQLSDKLELMTAQHQKALTSIDSLQTSVQSSEKDQAEKRGALNQIERMLKEIQTENNQLKERNIELNITQKQLNEQYTAATNKLTEIEPQLHEVQKIKTSHKGDLQQLKLTIASQGEELLKAQAQLKAYSELKSVNLALDSNNKNLNTAFVNLQKKYDGFHKEYLTMKSQFQLLRDKYEHLENSTNNIKITKAKSDKTNTTLSAELAALRTTQKALVTEKLSLEKRLKEMEKHLSTPQKKSSSSTQTTRLYKNGKTVATVPPDDLKIIEGIGGKIEVLLNNAGIFTWKQLSKTGIGELKRVLASGGAQLNLHNPSTWPEQAELAVENKWEQLEQFQKELGKKK